MATKVDPEGDFYQTVDNTGREYKYQADFTVQGAMFHVRCDNWEEFEQAVTLVKDNYVTTVTPTAPSAPYAANPYPTPESESACKTCGAPTLPEKRIQGKDGRSWWVRDCTTGDRTHKGPIRAAA